MAYAYICKACREGRHDQCEEAKLLPPGALLGGGVCICSHQDSWTVFERDILREQGT